MQDPAYNMEDSHKILMQTFERMKTLFLKILLTLLHLIKVTEVALVAKITKNLNKFSDIRVHYRPQVDDILKVWKNFLKFNLQLFFL